MKRNVADDPPVMYANPGDKEPPRQEESGDVCVHDERKPIDGVNLFGELDAPVEVDDLKDPYLDSVSEACVDHRDSIARSDVRLGARVAS